MNKTGDAMPENHVAPLETNPTVTLKVNADACSLLAEWVAIEVPVGYLEKDLFYAVELYRGTDRIAFGGPTDNSLQMLFTGIKFKGEHVFRATVQAIVAKAGPRVECGPLQFGEVKVKDGKDISVPRVTGVFASTLDDESSRLLLSVRWDATESEQAIAYSVKVVGKNSKLDAKPANNITVNLATFSDEESGIVAGEKYTVHVSAYSAETAGVESEGFEFIAGEDPNSEEDEYDAHFNANSGTAGDPINMGTGSFSYQHTDLQISGTPPFVFQTFYFSPDAVKSKYPAGKDDPAPDTLQVLGNGWSHTFMTFLRETDTRVVVYWGAGGKSRYKPLAPSLDGTRYSMKGVYDGSTLFYERKTARYILTTHAQQQYIFDDSGRLLQILSIEKNVIRLDYLDGRLHKVLKVTSADEKANDCFEFAYEGGRLKSVTDNFGRTIRYDVSNGNLASYTDPAGGSRLFTYHDRSLMKTASDQNGDVFIYNEYENERVVFQQDANAYALRKTDRYGLSIEYRKTGKAMTAAVTDNVGNSITYVSDSRGNLLSREVLLSETTSSYRSFKYDGFNNVTRETEYEGSRARTTEGKVTRHSYDGNLNRLTSCFVSPEGTIIDAGKFRYDRANQKIEETDHLGITTRYCFNANHELVGIDFPLGQTETLEYKTGIVKGLVERFTDRLGNSFHFTYERDLLISAIDPYGRVTRISAYLYGLPQRQQVLDQKDVLLQTTLNEYNLMGEKLSESVLYGKQPATKAFTTKFTLDALGQVKEMKTPGGHTTRYAYNPNMKLVKITFPAVNGVTSAFSLEYDRNDNVVLTNSGEGVTEERFAYDALNRCIGRTDGNGNSYQFEYQMDSAAGKPFTTTRRTVFPPLGNKTFSEAIVSDMFGRAVEAIDRDGQVTRIVYSSAEGRLKVVTLDPPAVLGDPKTQYRSEERFDELGRLIESTDREGNKTTTSYTVASTGPNNPHVGVVTESDPLKIETILHFDSDEQVLFARMAQEEGSYTYDALGRLTASEQRIRDGEQVRIAHTYSFDEGLSCLKVETTTAGNAILSASCFNGLNQLVKQKNGLGTITERRYDEKGQLSELLIGGGHKITYTYDTAGRNTRITFSDQSYLTNTYDGSGNCLETTQFNGGIETSKQARSFDAWNRQERLTDLKGGRATYQYNTAGQLTRLTYPALPGDSGGVAVDYTYDNLQRMVKVSDWKQRVTEYAYSPDGALLKATFSNRVISNYSFDKAQRLTGVKTSREGLIIFSTQWTLDGSGNPAKSRSLLPLAPAAETGSTQFKYDVANQLTDAGGVKIAYDVNGNPVSLPEAGNLRFNDLNLLTQCGSNEYAYDAQGVRASSKINGKLRRYWNSFNAYRAPYLSMLDPSESGIRGRDTGMAVNVAMPTGPQLDPLNQVLQITDESNKLEKRFVYGLGLIAEETAAGDYLVYHFDERGSTVAMSDQQGNVVNRFAYGVYGALTNQHGERSTPFLYNGQQGVLTDGNDLYSMCSRFYRPSNMRFLQQDFLLGNPFSSQSLNRYAYVGGNPIGYVDPLGLDRESRQGGGGSDWWKSDWLKYFFVVAGTAAAAYFLYRYKKAASLRRLALRKFHDAQLNMDLAVAAGKFVGLSVNHWGEERTRWAMNADKAATSQKWWLTGAGFAGGVAGTGVGLLIYPFFQQKDA